MKRTCKLCNGRGKQKNSLSCTCCKGQGFFDVTDKIGDCKACKGSGRGVIKTLACIKCGGKGFSVLSETAKLPEQEEKETRPAEREPEEKPIEEETPQIAEEEIPPEERPLEAPSEQEVSETKRSVYQEKLPETQTLPEKEPKIETPVRVGDIPEEKPGKEPAESFKEPEMSKADKRKTRRERRKKEKEAMLKNDQGVVL